MLSAERFQELLFDRDKVGISSPVFHALAYYLSPSEPALYRFLKNIDELAKSSAEDLDREFQSYCDLIGENIAELFWQAISESSDDNITRSAILLTIKTAEKSKNPALKYVAAHCLFENNLFREASRMLSYIPGANIDVLSMEGMCFFHLKEYQDSLSCFVNVLSIDPDDQLAKKFRCLCLVKLNRSVECRNELSQLWKIEKSLDLLIIYLSGEIAHLDYTDQLNRTFLDDCLAQASQIGLAIDAKSLDTFLKLAFEQTHEWRSILLSWITDQTLNSDHIHVLGNYLAESSKNGISDDSKLIQMALERIIDQANLNAL